MHRQTATATHCFRAASECGVFRKVPNAHREASGRFELGRALDQRGPEEAAVPLRAELDANFFNRIGETHLPEYLGVTILRVAEGVLEGSLLVRPQLMAPNGFLHAGSVVTLADTLAGYACVAHLPAEATGFTTIELKTNFLGTAREGTLIAEARAVHLGRTTQTWDATVWANESRSKPIALFRCTQLVLYVKRP